MEKQEISLLGVNWNKMMMWLFIISDALLFGALLCAYGFNRLASSSWPDRFHIFNMNFITVMTFVLISSSATMATAVAASRKGEKSALGFILLTILGGLSFLGMQAYEWSGLIQHGARLDSNPWGAPGFSGFFFTITGFHGTHVLTGVIILIIVAIKLKRGSCTANGVELAGLYWHFVDLVWVFIFGFFYLI